MESRGFFKTLKEYWQIILFIGLVIVGWTTVKNDVANLSTRVTRSESQIETINPVLLQLQTSMARVETTLEFIKLEISKH
jgi:uncharacterized coiled-coil protein SlyX